MVPLLLQPLVHKVTLDFCIYRMDHEGLSFRAAMPSFFRVLALCFEELILNMPLCVRMTYHSISFSLEMYAIEVYMIHLRGDHYIQSIELIMKKPQWCLIPYKA